MRAMIYRVGQTFGHEFIGIVEEVGPEVDNLKPGDKVLVPFNVCCGFCYFCSRGLYGNCHNTNLNATADRVKCAGDVAGACSGPVGAARDRGGRAGSDGEEGDGEGLRCHPDGQAPIHAHAVAPPDVDDEVRVRKRVPQPPAESSLDTDQLVV